MSWAQTQARLDAAARRRRRSPLVRPDITRFEPDDLIYLQGLKETLAAAGLMPPGIWTNPQARIDATLLSRARRAKDRLKALNYPTTTT